MFALLKDNNQQKSSIVYNVGLYLRLSREDGDSSESTSITNQRDFLTRYVLEQGWNLVDVFIDDGFSGTNFNRPDFQRLLKAVESRQINLVITKDLSRLGRDYIDTGYYVEKYFPSQNIRYIALNDGVDTFDTNNSNNDMSPFKSVMNDFYARDISKKVRTTMNIKRKNGQFIGSFAPYGYLKSPLDKNKLIVDPQAAPVVKRIFEMYLDGAGYRHISHTLNSEKVACPSVHKAAQYDKYRNAKATSGLWTSEAIKVILLNPTYAGNLAQHKYTMVSYKVKKLKATSRDSWLIVYGTHEPIVDPSTFEVAQQIMTAKAPMLKVGTRKVHLLGGLLYCKDCGARMTFTKTQKGIWYCICSSNKNFKRCSRHSYIEAELEDYIVDDLRRIAKAAVVDRSELIQIAQEETGEKVKTTATRISKEISTIEKRLDEIKRIIKALYEDKLKGILTEQDFIDLSREYSSERESLSSRLSKLSGSPQIEQDASNEDFMHYVLDLLEVNKLTRVLISKLISRVEITEDKTIEIYYNFKNPL